MGNRDSRHTINLLKTLHAPDVDGNHAACSTHQSVCLASAPHLDVGVLQKASGDLGQALAALLGRTIAVPTASQLPIALIMPSTPVPCRRGHYPRPKQHDRQACDPARRVNLENLVFHTPSLRPLFDVLQEWLDTPSL